ncbi:MAG: ABC transporter ATP-binding protein [Longimicrobiales bacterium]
MPAAELRDVVVRYDEAEALRGVDLALERGQVTVLLGPNGAGKTTAVRLWLGLIAPAAGEVAVFGHPPRSAAAKRRVGAMMQISKVPETLRVTEHIDTFRSYYPAPLPRRDLIEAAALSGLERRLFGKLSGGEKQRVLFALALAGDPDLLFLDEPTVGMDVETRRAFWERIRALRTHGRAVLLTTHYLEEADALADRVVVLHHGRIVADGPPAQIKRRVARRRIRCTTALDVKSVRAIDGVDAAHDDGGTITIIAARVEDVLRTLLARDPTLHGLEVAGAALEDAFLELTSDDEMESVA